MVLRPNMAAASVALVAYLTAAALPHGTNALLTPSSDRRPFLLSGTTRRVAAAANDESGESGGALNRRDALARASRSAAAAGAAVITSAAGTPSTPASRAADEAGVDRLASPQPISASWTATQGLNSLSSENTFVSFDPSAYAAMRDDQSRTPQFRKAIQNRLSSAPGGPASVSVLDLGTGPFALLAIIAAEAGAGKVYAIEASSAAAKSARETVAKAGFGDVVTILEGFSTDVELPEKVDVVLAEIVGSIVTEEGAYATILDAHKRFVKDPKDPSSWIPNRIQTYSAPASYLLHGVMGPPEFDWSKLAGEPVRFNCRDEGLQLLSDPALVEDVKFYEVDGAGGRKAGPSGGKGKLEFVVDPERIEDNELGFYLEVKRAARASGAPVMDAAAKDLARKTARSVTGVALWPRLFLDGTTVISSRKYPSGGQQKSHWQTVLPIMCDRPVQGVEGGDKVVVDVDFDFVTDKVNRAPQYKMKGEVIPQKA
mmetsp:Transcript_45545/g.138421  ORF Transcript_45545/g.138421 Transcript_45545/m.138421 type:complete len:486 (-) Transcript_45545:28-1485(-)